MPPDELTFQRACVHLVHDAQRLEDGQDLNDALLDFFVKLGQALLPAGPPPVAYLGSHFYDVLRKGGVKDGCEGHKNVANWARRQLGKDSLFADSIGAIAVPVNEVLQDSYGEVASQGNQEKHWWLALLLNPRAAGKARNGKEEDLSILCLDSFVRSETRYDPPVRAMRSGGTDPSYMAEVSSLSRVGFAISLNFRALGDGSAGPLAQPSKARLKAGGRTFPSLDVSLKGRERGGDGKPGRLEGSLSFRLDRRGAAKTVGQYILEYGEPGDDYQPALKLRMGETATPFQADVARFMGGYLGKEAEARGVASTTCKTADIVKKVAAAICLPGVPQQETSHDCGFFILEQILRALQLEPRALRDLATASAVEIAMLPWPSQKQVLRRKSMLREIMAALFSAARQTNTNDVEELLKNDNALRGRVRSALKDGCPSFQKGFARWEAGDWDLSPSPSRSRSRGRGSAKDKSRSRLRDSEKEDESSSDESRRKRKKKKGKKRKQDSSSAPRRGRSASRSASSSKDEDKKTSFTPQSLEGMSPKELRALCVEYGVLPVGAVEREDLVEALLPLAAGPKVVAPRRPAVVWPEITPALLTKTNLASVNEAAAAIAAKRAAPSRSPPPESFTRVGLESMPAKELRALCLQHGVLPSGSVEKGDLVRALAPLASPG